MMRRVVVTGGNGLGAMPPVAARFDGEGGR
jgi:hypothetical protein